MKTRQRAGFGRVCQVKIQDKFRSMSKFRCKDPRGFFVSAFVTSPADKVKEFAGTTSVVNLGIEDFGNFEFGFVVNCNRRRWGLNSIGNWVRSCWFQHRDVEYRVYSAETVRKS